MTGVIYANIERGCSLRGIERLKCAIRSIDAPSNREKIVDKGPWVLFNSGPPEMKLVGVISEDFEHDVVLQVNGDFESLEQRRKYCVWLLSILNRG